MDVINFFLFLLSTNLDCIFMKIKTLLFTVCFSILSVWVYGQETELVGANCTSIMVGRNASADGSVITSHTCDSKYRTWVTMEPAADHKAGEMHKVYKGTMHTETPRSMEGMTLAGEIPEAAHTYAYMNTAYPCLNEKQLAIGESTFSGPDTLTNEKGMFLIEELERIVLQRCDNARDAIKLMGELVAQYGYGDGGECLTIADKKEVWQFEILGEGPDKIGGIWVAQRVPDDHVAVSCNVARIGKIDRKNKDFFMASDNIEKVAKATSFGGRPSHPHTAGTRTSKNASGTFSTSWLLLCTSHWTLTSSHSPSNRTRKWMCAKLWNCSAPTTKVLPNWTRRRIYFILASAK